MFYDKKIRYLDYYENGERVRGGGYVKLEIRDRSLRLDLAVTGLYATDAFERDVVLLGENKESVLGKIKIVSGKGSFQYMCQDIRDMGRMGISYEECRGLRISLGAGREVGCSWQVGKAASLELAVAEKTEEDGAKAVSLKRIAGDKGGNGKEAKADLGERVGKVGTDIREESRRGRREEHAGNAGKQERAEIEMQDPSQEQDDRKNESRHDKENRENGRKGLWGGEEKQADRESRLWEDEGKRRAEEKKIWDSEGSGKGNSSGGRKRQKEEGLQEKRKEDRESGWIQREKDGNGMRNSMGSTGGSPGRGRGEEKPVQLLEDKWQQLYAIYPHIRPFDDDREYISIKPADFVLFPAESYRIVNNSFLLHGYYNYRHLILAKAERKGETVYYIGVPGNFYEKEKQVAIMFGFESFECAEEPAQAGDFGYYMMRTQL